MAPYDVQVGNVCEAFGVPPAVALAHLGAGPCTPRQLGAHTRAAAQAMLISGMLEALDRAQAQGSKTPPKFTPEQSSFLFEVRREASRCDHCGAAPGEFHADDCPVEFSCDTCGALLTEGEPHDPRCVVVTEGAHGLD